MTRPRQTAEHLSKRTDHTGKTLAQHMRIDLRRAYIGVPQQRLHGPDITATAQQLGGQNCGEKYGNWLVCTGWIA